MITQGGTKNHTKLVAVILSNNRFSTTARLR